MQIYFYNNRLNISNSYLDGCLLEEKKALLILLQVLSKSPIVMPPLYLNSLYYSTSQGYKRIMFIW